MKNIDTCLRTILKAGLLTNIVELGRRIPTEENHLTYAEKKNRKEEMTPRRTQNIIMPLGGEDKSFFINVVNV